MDEAGRTMTGKIRSHDIIIELQPIEGKATLTSAGLTDSRPIHWGEQATR